MEGRICHDKECENVAARDSQVCDHHAVAYDVPALEHSDVVVCGTVVPGNLVQAMHISLVLVDEFQEIIHRHRDIVIGEGVEHVLQSLVVMKSERDRVYPPWSEK